MSRTSFDSGGAGATHSALDRLALRRSERGYRRSDEAHLQALERLETLLHWSGGIYFGGNLEAQLAITTCTAKARRQQLRVSVELGLNRTSSDAFQVLGYKLPQLLPQQEFSSVNSTDAPEQLQCMEFQAFNLPPLSTTHENPHPHEDHQTL